MITKPALSVALRTEQLTKLYSLPRTKSMRTAVDRLDLTVQVGEIFGFLGPNGAGKTTTIKMLLSFVAPSSGTAWILGEPAEIDRARRNIGYVPEQPYFPKFLTCLELVKGHGAMHGLSGKESASRAQSCLEMVGMADVRHSPLAQLSKGMTQRVGLACALVGDPKLLILDEPSSGLDPVGRRELQELLCRFREQGKTIFLSSHLLSEVESVCDRVGVLSAGVLVACGAPEQIVRARDEVAVEFQVELPDPLIEEQIRRLGGVCDANDAVEKQSLLTALMPSKYVYDLIGLLRKRHAKLCSVIPQRESLEDAFLRLVKGAAR
jgi:ABC-2 type transport system ATP-binding protein